MAGGSYAAGRGGRRHADGHGRTGTADRGGDATCRGRRRTAGRGGIVHSQQRRNKDGRPRGGSWRRSHATDRGMRTAATEQGWQAAIVRGRPRSKGPAAGGGSYAAGRKRRRYAAALGGTRTAGSGGGSYKAGRGKMRTAGHGGDPTGRRGGLRPAGRGGIRTTGRGGDPGRDCTQPAAVMQRQGRIGLTLQLAAHDNAG